MVLVANNNNNNYAIHYVGIELLLALRVRAPALCLALPVSRYLPQLDHGGSPAPALVDRRHIDSWENVAPFG